MKTGVNIAIGVAIAVVVAAMIIFFGWNGRIEMEQEYQRQILEFRDQATKDSLTAERLRKSNDSLMVLAETRKELAAKEHAEKIAAIKRLKELALNKVQSAKAEDVVLAFLSTTDSLFSGKIPAGDARDGDTLYPISVMNLRAANGLFISYEYEMEMTEALLDYQAELLNTIDVLERAGAGYKAEADVWKDRGAKLESIIETLNHSNQNFANSWKRAQLYNKILIGVSAASILFAIFR